MGRTYARAFVAVIADDARAPRDRAFLMQRDIAAAANHVSIVTRRG
jgi:hypothetical protein